MATAGEADKRGFRVGVLCEVLWLKMSRTPGSQRTTVELFNKT